MISGSNNKFQLLSKRVSDAAATATKIEAQTTSSVPQNQVQSSSVNVLGSISNLVSGITSIVNSVVGLIGGLFNRRSTSSVPAAQSVSSLSQNTPVVSASSIAPRLAARLSGQGQSSTPVQVSTQPTVTTTVKPTPPVLIQPTQPAPIITNPSVPSATASTSQVSALAITPSLQSAANKALPDIDRVLSQFMLLKPALDLFQVKKPSADEIMNNLMEAKVAINQISQGQQPTVHGGGLADFGKQTFKFTNDALRIVMTAKGLAQLFNYKDAGFQKAIGEAEKALMDVRVFSDILSRSIQ